MKLPLPIDMYLKVSSRFYFCRRWTVAVLAVFGLLMAARLALCVLNLPEDFAMEVAKYPVVQANPDLDPFELVVIIIGYFLLLPKFSHFQIRYIDKL